MERKRSYGEGEDKKLRPTSFFVRALAQPDPENPGQKLYPTDLDLLKQKVAGADTDEAQLHRYKARINQARFKFAERMLMPESMPATTAAEHREDIEYIRSLYPDQGLTEDKILLMLERSDGSHTNFSLIRGRMKVTEPTPPIPQLSNGSGESSLADWNEKHGHQWFLDLLKQRVPEPIFGSGSTEEPKVPDNLDRPMVNQHSGIAPSRR